MHDRRNEIAQRILRAGSEAFFDHDCRSLLHAYIACLDFGDLCALTAEMIGEPAPIRLGLRGRLLRLLREDASHARSGALAQLVEQTEAAAKREKSHRRAADALHAAIFSYLPLPTQQDVLDSWMGRASKPSAARWLKATKEVPELFDSGLALAYWRASKDERAAKSIAYQAAPDVVAEFLPELLATDAPGWIVSKAALRASGVDEAGWKKIREKHPATYLYLCARLGRNVADDEAFELTVSCPHPVMEGGRGLAIWALGQMGKIDVLDRVFDAAPGLQESDFADFASLHSS